MTEAVEAASSSPAAADVRTFLIADVRGYTRFTVEHGDEVAAKLASRFAEIAREVVGARDGEVIELRGDEALAVFASSRQALRAATELQARFSQASHDDPDLPLRVGVGLDAGEAIPIEGGYRGTALNLAARLCSLAGPGEVLASDGVIHLARKVDGIEYRERGMVQLKGFEEPVRAMEVLAKSSGPEGTVIGPLVETPREIPIGGYLGSLPANSLVGREAELERALASVESAIGGKGKLLLLAGEPGAGKTRLAQEVTLNLRNRGFLLAAGRCYEAQQSVPFYPFVEALTDLYRLAPESIRREVLRRWSDIARLLPELGLPVSDYAGSQDQQRLFWAVSGFLQAISAEIPVALLLDDLHWADAASLELLQHLARQTDAYRVLLLGTYRDVEVNRQHPLEAALRDLQREDLIERIEVRRLDEEDTRGLIASIMGADDVSEEFARLIHHRTEGNAFFVQQVLRVLIERGDVYWEDGRWGRREIAEIDVPESVRSVVGQRLSRLGEETQEILREASVLGQTFAFDDLQAMTGREEREVEAALDAAAVAGMIREEEGDTYAFDHALTQGALYLELSSRRRRRLHLAAADAIQSLPERKHSPRAAELAWHFLEGDDPERALVWSMKAGEQAEAVFAHSDAERHFRTAVQLAEETDDHAAAMKARERLADVLSSQSRNAEALEVLEVVARFHREHADLEGEIRVMAQIGWNLFSQGLGNEGINRLQPIQERWEREPAVSAAAGSLHVTLAELYWYTGRNEEALVASEEAVALAEEVGDDQLLGRAEGRQGLMLSVLGRNEEALTAYNRSIQLSEASDDLLTLQRALNNRSIIHLGRRDLPAQFADLSRALEVARRLGNPTSIAWQLWGLAEVLIDSGRRDDARPLLLQLIEMERSIRHTRASGYVTNALRSLYESGERPLSDLEQLVNEAERTGDMTRWSWGQSNLASVDLMEDRPERARERMRAVLALPDSEEQSRIDFEWMSCLADLATGEILSAEALAAQRFEEADAENSVLLGARWVIPLARVRAAQGRTEEAVSLLEGELRKLRQDLPEFELAWTLYNLGVVLAAGGRREEARARLEEALGIMQGNGNKLFAGCIEREIAGLA